MCGLSRKLEYPELVQSIRDVDCYFLQETKCDKLDSENIKIDLAKIGYTFHAKNRSNQTARRSGGLAIAVKQEFDHLLRTIETESNYVQWCTIDKSVFQTERDILIGNVYWPPDGSPFADDTSLDEVDLELLNICNNNQYYVGIIGDFNAHTGTLPDYVLPNTDVNADHDDVLYVNDDVTLLGHDKNELGVNILSNLPNVNIDRISPDDTRTGNYGERLLEMCKAQKLYIANGRVGQDRVQGKATTKHGTVIDYFIASAELLSLVTELNINDFDHLYSDAHCRLHVTLKGKPAASIIAPETNNTEEPPEEGEQNIERDKRKRVKWNKRKAE